MSKNRFFAILFVMGALLYLVLPIDLIPDGFIGIGQLDDLAILIGSISHAVHVFAQKSLPEA